MKKLLVSVLAAMMVCSMTACGGGNTAGGGNVGGLSEEELAKQEEEARKEAEKELEEAMKEEVAKREEEARKELEESVKQEEAKKESEAQTQPQVDPEAVLSEALPTIPEIPAGEYEYDYEWSERFGRVDYYIVKYNTPVDYETFLDYVYTLVNDGFEDPGKGDWSEEYGETYFLDRQEGKISGIRINWKANENGEGGTLTFEFYVNERV